MHKITCSECRHNYEEGDRNPPCEDAPCPIEAVDLLPKNQMAFDLYGKVKALGAELVFRLLPIKLSPAQAEDLLEKMEIIANTVARVQKQMKETEQP